MKEEQKAEEFMKSRTHPNATSINIYYKDMVDYAKTLTEPLEIKLSEIKEERAESNMWRSCLCNYYLSKIGELEKEIQRLKNEVEEWKGFATTRKHKNRKLQEENKEQAERIKELEEGIESALSEIGIVGMVEKLRELLKGNKE